MPPRARTLKATTALALTGALAGCITITPVTPTNLGAAASSKPVAGASAGTAAPKAGATKKTPAAAVKPKAGDAAALDKLKSAGRVQVSFKGLAGPARRALKQTTEDIARVEVTLTDANGKAQTQGLTRAQMFGPVASLFFDAVPVGGATLTVQVFDAGGGTIGKDEAGLDVQGGKTTEVPMRVKLGNTGGVAAEITFEEPEINASNVTGFWYVGDGPQPPDYPLSGCGEGYVWSVTQVNDTVWASVSGYNDASDPKHPNSWWSEEAYGTMHGNEVELQGRITYTDENGQPAGAPEEAAYALTFDPNRWVMTGTRNGRAGWAAPYSFDPNCYGGPQPEPFPSGGPYPYPSEEPYPYPSGGPYPYPSGPYPFPMPSATAYVPQGTTVVQGTFRDEAGNPVRGATVYFDSYNSQAAFSATALTDDEGRFTFSEVPQGVEISIYATDNAGREANSWQVFYSYDSEAPSVDLWAYAPSPEPIAAVTCMPTSYPTIGAGGKPITWSTCEPVYPCEPTTYPTIGAEGKPITWSTCAPVAYPASAMPGTPGPSWAPGPGASPAFPMPRPSATGGSL